MFFILGVLFLLAGAIPLILTLKRRDSYSEDQFRHKLKKAVIVLIVDIAALIIINVYFFFFTDFLWFKSLGYENRFLLVLQTRIVLFFIGAAIAYVFYSSHVRASRLVGGADIPTATALPVVIVLTVISAVWASNLWDSYLLFANQAETSLTDPIFGQSISFYLFSLSFLSNVVGWFIFLFVVSIAVLGFLANGINNKLNSPAEEENAMLNQQMNLIVQRLLLLGGFLFLLIAFNTYLGIFRLLYSPEGVVTGAGWTDIHVRLPAHYVSVVVFALLGVLLIIGGFKRSFLAKLFALRTDSNNKIKTSRATWIFPAGVIAVLVLANGIIPALVQSVIVEPNELTKEQQYIPHNIDNTRKAYGIDEERITSRTYEVGTDVDRTITEQNQSTIDNIRLWDWRALRSNLQQQQEMRLYYNFHDVDIDRYNFGGDYRQVMLSVREMEKADLAPESQTWMNRHLKYTHGYGLVMIDSHEFKTQGGPQLLVKGIPPEETVEDFTIERPQIYYGERTNDHVYANTTQQEFDYPSGDENKYTDYTGKGGVVLDSFWKRFVYAWKFDGYRQLFSGYFTRESRVMYNRNILSRVKRLAPFLRLSSDPYAVVTDKGEIKYIVDAYTVSRHYPYSEAYRGSMQQYAGINYIRNSVKVVVDAYNGETTFYLMEPDDIIATTYGNMFPELFRPFEKMPEYLKKHIRYPAEYFTIQAEMYRTYHMTDVGAFYQREDVWEFATERYGEGFLPVQPYYIMVHFPEEEQMEYVIMLPFTPKNKNVINAWLAGRSDVPNYGKVMSFAFPKGVEVLGPRQIEARIDQDSEMSRNLSLWSQQGSDVIRGNLLAVPLFKEETMYIMFAESIFIQAEGAKLPEIKRVALADQEQVVWAETFEASLRKLAGVAAPPSEQAAGEAAQAAAAAGGEKRVVLPQDLQNKIDEAVSTFEAYTDAVSQSNFQEAGEKLDTLKGLIQELKDR
ncbi:MAG: UPF0182 family protein [Spirochaetales bacterium]|nr:UPF0182 family protein [Spirochaetales bacterium]MCF7936972.1 UPF0182 family protein [Spirochaetales bacterium]